MRGSTADQIGHGLKRLEVQGVTPVGLRDVAVMCVDLPADTWAIFPISLALAITLRTW